MLTEFEQPGIGRVLAPRVPLKFGGSPAADAVPAPVLGGNADEVLVSELGLGADARDQLGSAGVVRLGNDQLGLCVRTQSKLLAKCPMKYATPSRDRSAHSNCNSSKFEGIRGMQVSKPWTDGLGSAISPSFLKRSDRTEVPARTRHRSAAVDP